MLICPNVVRADDLNNKLVQKNKEGCNILVDISEFKMYLIEKGSNKPIRRYPIAGGKPETPSPYGTWKIVSKSANWGSGFGTRWVGLNVTWGQYGIHGDGMKYIILKFKVENNLEFTHNIDEEMYNKLGMQPFE